MSQFSQALERAGVAVEWKVTQISPLVKRIYYMRFVGIFIVHLNNILSTATLRKAIMSVGGRKAVLTTEPLTAITLRLCSIPTAYWSISGVVEWWHLQSRVERMSVILTSLVEIIAIRTASVAIAESHRIGGLLVRAAKVPVYVVPWGVDSEVFTPKKRTGNSPGMTILFAGLIRDAKGVDTLVHACCMIAPEFDVMLRIAGPVYPAWLKFVGRLKEEAKAAGLKLEFMGYVGWEELSVVMANADVLVMPSRHEGLANVVLEAMSSGIPVITSRVAGMPEVVEKSKCGLVFDPNDVSTLATQLRTLLGCPQLRREFGDSGRKASLQDFSWDVIAQTMINVLHL